MTGPERCAARDAAASPQVADPLITMAIPTFNRAGWLKECVASALAQSYTSFEVLVSDNASTDETQKVLSTFSDPRLRVVRQETNIGLLPNWNACVEQARGSYLVVLSDDDRVAPWFLERCVELIRREPGLPIVAALSDLYLIDEERTLRASPSRKFETGIVDGADILREYLRSDIGLQMCTVVIRTDLLRRAKGFRTDLPYVADVAAWGPILLSGRAGFVNEPCGTYSWHDTSQTSKFPLELRLADDRKLTDILDEATARHVGDPGKAREIRLSARRHAARCAVSAITSRRRSGATLGETIRAIWRWRDELGHIGIDNAGALVRPIAILLFPRPVSDALSRLRRAARKLRSRPARANP